MVADEVPGRARGDTQPTQAGPCEVLGSQRRIGIAQRYGRAAPSAWAATGMHGAIQQLLGNAGVVHPAEVSQPLQLPAVQHKANGEGTAAGENSGNRHAV